MIRDILVNLTPGSNADLASRYAISLAEGYSAHVTGVAFAYDPAWPRALVEGTAADVYRIMKERSEAEARAALNHFEGAAKRSGLSAAGQVVATSYADAGSRFASLARTFDLSVIKQAEPGSDEPSESIVEAALFSSGRPVFIIPYIHRDEFKADRIVCCWDAGRPAARAIADSLPLLRKAAVVDLLTVTTDDSEDAEASGITMAAHLARHGLTVNLVRQPAADIDVASAILDYAFDASASAIVMGGYGHSRLREMALGGATRGILSTMTVPVFMSH